MFADALRYLLTALEIAAHRLGESQLLSTNPVTSQEPALEVYTPHFIGHPQWGRGPLEERAPSAQLALHRQLFAIELTVRARRREL